MARFEYWNPPIVILSGTLFLLIIASYVCYKSDGSSPIFVSSQSMFIGENIIKNTIRSSTSTSTSDTKIIPSLQSQGTKKVVHKSLQKSKLKFIEYGFLENLNNSFQKIREGQSRINSHLYKVSSKLLNGLSSSSMHGKEALERLYENFPSLLHDTGDKIKIMKGKGGSIIQFFLNLLKPRPSLFNPQPLGRKNRPAFNGWCIRMVDHENQLAFALIVGSFREEIVEKDKEDKKDENEWSLQKTLKGMKDFSIFKHERKGVEKIRDKVSSTWWSHDQKSEEKTLKGKDNRKTTLRNDEKDNLEKTEEEYTEHYVVLTYSDQKGNKFSSHAFPLPHTVRIRTNASYVNIQNTNIYQNISSLMTEYDDINDANFNRKEVENEASITYAKRANANFEWQADNLGSLVFYNDNKGEFNFSLPGFSASGTFNDRVPWSYVDLDINTSGPEGWLGHTSLLPCRYFIQSLASSTNYNLFIDKAFHNESNTANKLSQSLIKEILSIPSENHGTKQSTWRSRFLDTRDTKVSKFLSRIRGGSDGSIDGNEFTFIYDIFQKTPSNDMQVVGKIVKESEVKSSDTEEISNYNLSYSLPSDLENSTELLRTANVSSSSETKYIMENVEKSKEEISPSITGEWVADGDTNVNILPESEENRKESQRGSAENKSVESNLPLVNEESFTSLSDISNDNTNKDPFLPIDDREQDASDSNSYISIVNGHAYSHQEANSGNKFPKGWIWSQAVNEDRSVQIIIVGGSFEIGSISPNTWIIGYRSPLFQWNFRTTDLAIVKSSIDYENHQVYLHVRDTKFNKNLWINIEAPADSFGENIYIPTENGFQNNPGCRESFTATISISAEDKKLKMSEEHVIPLAALEFGGERQKLGQY